MGVLATRKKNEVVAIAVRPITTPIPAFLECIISPTNNKKRKACFSKKLWMMQTKWKDNLVGLMFKTVTL